MPDFNLDLDSNRPEDRANVNWLAVLFHTESSCRSLPIISHHCRYRSVGRAVFVAFNFLDLVDSIKFHGGPVPMDAAMKATAYRSRLLFHMFGGRDAGLKDGYSIDFLL